MFCFVFRLAVARAFTPSGPWSGFNVLERSMKLLCRLFACDDLDILFVTALSHHHGVLMTFDIEIAQINCIWTVYPSAKDFLGVSISLLWYSSMSDTLLCLILFDV